MYLALFLAPWILMYSLSTLAMNHRKSLQAWFGEAPPAFEKEREVDIAPGLFSAQADAKENAKRLLQTLDMDGMHGVPKSGPKKLVVVRQYAAAPVRVTYTPESGKAVIEKQPSSFHLFLERMHRRRGYQHPYGTDQVWAFSVDLVVVVIVFWVLSGLWMWWELKATRVLGALSAAAGLGLFAWLVSIL